MKLIPHHQDDKAGHERHEDHAGWHCHAAFERRRDALVFLDTTAATPGGESTAVTTMAPKQRETPERSAEPPPPSPRRTPRRPITHYIDETRSEDIRWSLCGVFLYDEKQIAKGDEPATCGKCQRYTTATSYLKRQDCEEDCEEDLTGRAVARASNDRD